MVAVVLAALALGIATTIGIVAVVTILARHTLGLALTQRLPQLERGARLLQGIAGGAIIVIGLVTVAQLRLWRPASIVAGGLRRFANRATAERAITSCCETSASRRGRWRLEFSGACGSTFDRQSGGAPFGEAVLKAADFEALRAQLRDRFKG